jgi:kynureninase
MSSPICLALRANTGVNQYAVESQLRHHNFDPKEGMVLIEPKNLDKPTLSTEQIIKVIDDNASNTALVLLSAIQFYTGQYFDIERITAHAHSKGILIGWDCAHAAGNVDLRLHEWNVDFAAWCNYKYLNSGPGGMAGLFVHERHGRVDEKQPDSDETFRPRLSGWWGSDIKTRFNMDNSKSCSVVLARRTDNCRIPAPNRCRWFPAVQSFCLGYQRRYRIS